MTAMWYRTRSDDGRSEPNYDGDQNGGRGANGKSGRERMKELRFPFHVFDLAPDGIAKDDGAGDVQVMTLGGAGKSPATAWAAYCSNPDAKAAAHRYTRP